MAWCDDKPGMYCTPCTRKRGKRKRRKRTTYLIGNLSLFYYKGENYINPTVAWHDQYPKGSPPKPLSLLPNKCHWLGKAQTGDDTLGTLVLPQTSRCHSVQIQRFRGPRNVRAIKPDSSNNSESEAKLQSCLIFRGACT